MNIGVVVDNTFFNDERVKREVDILKDHFGKVFVLCFDFGEGSVSNSDENIVIRQFRIKRKYKDLLVFIQNWFPKYESLWVEQISHFIDDHSIDIIHTHDLYMARAARIGIERSKGNCKLVLDLHENYPEVVKSYSWTRGWIRRPISRPHYWTKKEEEYLNYADKVIVLSESYKKQLLDKYSDFSESNFIVFPNVPDLPTLRSYGENEDLQELNLSHPVFLYFGVIGRRRGVFQTIEVFKDYLKKGNSGTLLFIGPIDKYDKKEFIADINTEEIRSNVKYIPWININQLPSYLKISDVCLAPFEKNPQHESGISNKIYQYMFGKKPIISSNCKPQQELIKKCNCGVIFSNDQEYLDALERIGNDKSIQEELGKNGYNALMEHYNLDKYKSIITDLYDVLAKEITKNKDN